MGPTGDGAQFQVNEPTEHTRRLIPRIVLQDQIHTVTGSRGLSYETIRSRAGSDRSAVDRRDTIGLVPSLESIGQLAQRLACLGGGSRVGSRRRRHAGGVLHQANDRARHRGNDRNAGNRLDQAYADPAADSATQTATQMQSKTTIPTAINNMAGNARTHRIHRHGRIHVHGRHHCV